MVLHHEREAMHQIMSLTRDASSLGTGSPTAPTFNGQFDNALASCSSVYCIDLMLQRMVASVRVASPKSRVDEPEVQISAFESKQRHHDVNPETLARKWNIGLDQARQTLRVTTQLGVRQAVHPLTRRYRTDLMQQNVKRLNTTFYTDTLFCPIKSINGNSCAQVFTNQHMVRVHPMASKAEAGIALKAFIADVGAPHKMIFDGAREQTGPKTEFQRQIRRHEIQTHHNEPYTSKQNRAEDQIGVLRRRWKRRMAKKHVPRALWDYGLIYESEILTRMARGDRTGYEEVTGETPDISEWLDFEFYDLVWYWDHPQADDNPRLGRWLGVSHRIGSALCYWILKENGRVVSRTTVQHVTSLDLQQPETKQRVTQLDQDLHELLDKDLPEHPMGQDHFYQHDLYLEGREDDPCDPEEVQQQGQPHAINEEDAPEHSPDTYDDLVGAQLMLPKGDNWQQGRVIKRARGEDGKPIGTRHQNPSMDTRQYVVKMPDGSVEVHFANIIAENIFSQVDSEGRSFSILKEINDHRKGVEAVSKDDAFYVSSNGNRIPKRTTRGWELLVEWKDGTLDWIPLHELKKGNPIEVAEYALANKIDDEPAFSWWVHSTLRKRNRIISKVKSRYWKTTHKFGIEVPKTVKRALVLEH